MYLTLKKLFLPLAILIAIPSLWGNNAGKGQIGVLLDRPAEVRPVEVFQGDEEIPALKWRGEGFSFDFSRFDYALETIHRLKAEYDLLALVKHYEGFSSTAYYDSDGRVAIGYGFRRTDIPDLRMGDTMSRAEADRKLIEVMDLHAKIVDKYVTVELTEYQRCALTSFVYNVGETNFGKSTLLKRINEGNIDLAAKNFKFWCKIRGREIEGLKQRRAAEKDLFMKEG